MHALLLKFPFDEHKRKREFNSMEIALIGIENNLSARRNYNHSTTTNSYKNKWNNKSQKYKQPTKKQQERI